MAGYYKRHKKWTFDVVYHMLYVPTVIDGRKYADVAAEMGISKNRISELLKQYKLRNTRQIIWLGTREEIEIYRIKYFSNSILK